MNLRVPLAALVLAAFSPVAGSAQNYGIPTPAPRSTADATLLARARDREVRERFARGLAAEDRADWRTAVDEFERVIALDPPEPQGSTARYDLGIALARSGENRKAKGAFVEALRRDTGFAAAAANLVIVALLDNDLETAQTAAAQFLAIAPSSLRAQYQSGIVALRRGDLPAARSAFSQLISGAPGYAVAHYDLALIDLREERYDAARAELDQALLLSPGYARARFVRATLFVRAGQPDAARADLDRVVSDAADPSLRDVATVLRDRLTNPKL